MCRATPGDFANPLAGPRWNGWGVNTANTRYQDGEQAGFTAADVARLKPKWAFGFPGELSADAQPTIVGGRVFVGTQSGTVYALSAATGCVHWVFRADAAVRAAVTVARIDAASGPRFAAFIGDRSGNVYAIDAASGAQIWKTKVDDFPFARVTGSPTFHDGRLYVGVASGEETAGAVADYECCKFRGSLVALNAATGRAGLEDLHAARGQADHEEQDRHAAVGPVGRAHLVQPGDRHAAQGRLRHHRQQLQRSGHHDKRRVRGLRHGQRQDPVVAPDDSRETPGTPRAACPTRSTAPRREAPDFDFASPPILVALPNGRRALVSGQKSGVVHALDPDREGQILWQQRVGKGGINGGVQWGSAADRANVYVALSDIGRIPVPNSQATLPDPETGGGMFALRLEDGRQVWNTPATPCRRPRCSPAQSAPVSAMPGVVFSGSVDGHLRAYSTSTGAILWDVDTVGAHKTVNGVAARGGSLNVAGPAISGGTVIVNSGYVQNGIPGNVLLAFSVDGK